MAKQTVELKFDDKTAAALAEKTIEMYERKQTENNKVRQKRVKSMIYRLLKNYGKLKGGNAATIDALLDTSDYSYETLLDCMGIPREAVRLQSVGKTAARTNRLLASLDNNIETIRRNIKTDLDARRFECFYNVYLSERPLQVGEIAKKENISTKQVYDDISRIVGNLTVMWLGVEGLLEDLAT